MAGRFGPERQLAHPIRIVAANRQTSVGMNRDAIGDELRRLESEVVEGERELAQQEKLVAELKRNNQDTTQAGAELESMRRRQHSRQQDRLRLLSLLQP